MKIEQLRKEFEAWHLEEYDAEASDTFSTDEWQSYKAAAKSRDELIGELRKSLIHAKLILEDNMKFNAFVRPATGEALNVLNQALAEAQAQGYGE